MNKKLICLIAGSQLQGVGQTIRSMDTDAKGVDDAIGLVAQLGGQALVAFGNDQLKNAESILLNAADSIYTALGRTPPSTGG
jgi:hypothetical protein